MPTPSKFTAESRQKVLEALRVGASQRTAAAVAGVDVATLRRWVERGKAAAQGTRWAQFAADYEEAEAHPRVRALGIIYSELPDNPGLAWKFIERREPGYAPPMPVAPAGPVGPVVIQLSLSDGSLPAIGMLDDPNVIEGEVASESDERPEPATPASA